MNTLRRWLLWRLAPLLAKRPVLLVFGVLLYLVWPADLIPELFTGPLGFIDDMLILSLPFLVVRHLSLKKKGIKPPPPFDKVVDTTAETQKDSSKKSPSSD